MHAAIVAGGLGTRAAEMTGGRIPKALLPVAGVPIVFRQLRVLRREGVRRVSVLAGHLGDQLQRSLEPEATSLGLTLRIIIERAPLGTAGCLGELGLVTEETILVYGDMLFDIALPPLAEFHRRQQAILTVVVHPNDHPRTSDLIVEQDGKVAAILPRDRPRGEDHRNVVPAGLYFASPAFFGFLRRGVKADMVAEVLPALLASGERLAAYNTPEYLRDVGSPARHRMAEVDLATGRVEVARRTNLRPAIFFDCDGVLNEEPGDPGVVRADQVKLLPGAAAAVRRAHEGGRLAVAVTNRPQVAKGMVSLEGLSHILGRLEALMAAEGGVLDRIYYCPHHPNAGYPGEVPALKIECECRKPGTLLFWRAFADLPIDRRRSVVIGDSFRDIGAARALGLWAYGVRTGHACQDGQRCRRETGLPPVPDLMFENVLETVEFELSHGVLAERCAAEILHLFKKRNHPLLIGVCGLSRAGKTVLAHAITRVLSEQGIACLHLRLDHWIVPGAEDAAKASAQAFKPNRVTALPDLVRALRAGAIVRAPGYDALTCGDGDVVSYDPSGQSVIVLDGSFAGHESIRALLDFLVFVAVRSEAQQARFSAYYRWKGLEQKAIESLWRERTCEEWPSVDAQRSRADLIVGTSDS